MSTKKQNLINTLSSTISPDLVTGWKSSIGNSVRGEIVGLPKHRQATVFVYVRADGLFSAEVDGRVCDHDQTTPESAVCSAIREWAKHQTFDHLPTHVRALPGVAEDAQEKKRVELRTKIFHAKAQLDCSARERDKLTVIIDRLNKSLEHYEQTLKTMETM